MSDLAAPSSRFVVDETKPDDYPGFMLGEGNIYSCRYGIHLESADEFHPPKAQMFAEILAQALPGIVHHRVVLKRFDVYFNKRTNTLKTANGAIIGGIIGGVVGAAIINSGGDNDNVSVFKKIILIRNPLDVKHSPDAHQVGCDNAHEGEYYASDIAPGNDVVVTWLTFEVDSEPYRFESYYQFKPHSEKNAVQRAIPNAIRMTIEGAASKIKLGGPSDGVTAVTAKKG
ncbi:MAG TPA: hypothetical protein VFK96_01025 [Gammaproteobacteria bacterium]|nr:hypothetical protein [Gammaproteobacteria bacterium]